MNQQEAIITKFYTAFQQKDAATMNSCYADDIVFSDPVFGMMQGDAVRAMWQMLCARAKDFSLEFGNIQCLDEEYATCNWTATYTFGGTGRKVVNKITAHMRIQNSIITEHSDAFSLYKWCRQALGPIGWIFGWSGFVHNSVRRKALKGLSQFMQQAAN